MNKQYTISEKNELLQQIKKLNQEYRAGHPSVSDSEYDSLIDQLRELDPNSDWFSHIEPASISNSRKRSLPIPMKSLNKVKSITELKKWYQSLGLNGNTGVVCMPKFDGLSLLHDEWTGEAYSRGGVENEGQDCTKHYQATSKCQFINNNFHFTFGEFVISRKDWEQHFQGQNSNLTGEPFKSPRNTAAGLLNRDEPCQYLQYASFFRYGVDELSMRDFDNFHSLIETICHDYQQEHLYQFTFIGELTDDFLMGLFQKWSKIYPIDGIVIYIDMLHLWKNIGRNQTTGNPLYAIAYKHPDFTETFETTVKDIVWKASKSGALKPVVNIETINTGDCNMENPTGYNAGWINDHELAKGAKILVTRSGGVIPKILETLVPASTEEQERLWDNLSECPHCGLPTYWNENHIELCCTNPKCPGIKLSKAIFFYTTCGAENMGEETLAKIAEAGFDTIPMMLNVQYKDLIAIEGFGDSIANIILDNNLKIKKGVDMATLMQASSCFSGIGKIKAQKLLDEMDSITIDNFFSQKYVPMNKTYDSFQKMDKTHQTFELGVKSFYRFLSDTKIPPIKLNPVSINISSICSGMSVCVSGFRDSVMEQFIKENGGTIVSGVSKKTTHLIVKDINTISSKINKAIDLGITIISIDEFRQRYNFHK